MFQQIIFKRFLSDKDIKFMKEPENVLLREQYLLNVHYEIYFIINSVELVVLR